MTASATAGRVLLVSSDDVPLTEIEDQLADAGYAVRRCHLDGAPSFPCHGVVDGACPLAAEGGIDVAVDVRQHPWPFPTPREVGVTCALRAGVPVVVLGRDPHPFEPWAAATTSDRARLVETCEDAVVGALEPARAAAAGAIADVFETHGFGRDHAFSVRLERRLAELQVRIAADVPRQVAAMAATRAAVAVRRFDPSASKVEIEVVEPMRQR